MVGAVFVGVGVVLFFSCPGGIELFVRGGGGGAVSTRWIGGAMVE